MISPPRQLAGRANEFIVVRALNDGKVLIDGQGVRRPIYLYSNDSFLLEGMNACCSSASVVEIAGSSRDIIRRVVAWDAHDGNDKVFAIHRATHNTLEDVAAWGTARKTYEFSYGGDFTTVRRAWGRWERSTVAGPKMVYSLVYNNVHTIVENALGTWNGERMPEQYVLKDFYGRPWTGRGAGIQYDRDVTEPYGVFSIDGLPAGVKADARLLGSLAYVNPDDVFQPQRLVFVTKVDGVRIADTAAYFPPRKFADKVTFGLFALADGSRPENDVAENITGFGGSGPDIKRRWVVRNELHGPAPESTYHSGENIFNTRRGANLCYRYEDGVRTDKPLWPWPMNQRIIDGLIQSGRKPVDVTARVEQMFGPIPAPCRVPNREDRDPARSTPTQK